MTRQEKIIVDLLAEGHSSRQIAEKLQISFHTVETHRKNLRMKFGVSSTMKVLLMVYSKEVQTVAVIS